MCERLTSKAIAGRLFQDCVTYRYKSLFENEDQNLINALHHLFIEKGDDCLEMVKNKILELKESLEHYPYVVICSRKHQQTYTCSFSSWQKALDQVCYLHQYEKAFDFCTIYDAKENKRYCWDEVKGIIKEYYVVSHKCEENDANGYPDEVTTVPDTAIQLTNYWLNLDRVPFMLTREKLDLGNGDFHYSHIVRNDSGRLKVRHFTYSVKRVNINLNK